MSAQEKKDRELVLQIEDQSHNGREDYVGWFGLGGSVFQWHPQLKIGFGYVPYDFIPIDFRNSKAAKL